MHHLLMPRRLNGNYSCSCKSRSRSRSPDVIRSSTLIINRAFNHFSFWNAVSRSGRPLRFSICSSVRKANFNYLRMDEEFPERAAAKPGPEAMNAECRFTGIDPIPEQYRTVRQILTESPVELIVTEDYFGVRFPCFWDEEMLVLVS